MAQYYVKFFGGALKVRNVIGLAPISHGSTASGLENWIKAALQLFPRLKDFITTHDPAALQQLRGSAFLTQLDSLPDTVPGVHHTPAFDHVALQEVLNAPDPPPPRPARHGALFRIR